MTKDVEDIYNQVILMLEEKFSKVNNNPNSKRFDLFKIKPIFVNGKEAATMLIGVDKCNTINVFCTFIKDNAKTDSVIEGFIFKNLEIKRIGYKSEKESTTKNKIKQINEFIVNIDKAVEIIEKTISIFINTCKPAYNIVMDVFVSNSKITVSCNSPYMHEFVSIKGTFKSIKSKFFILFNNDRTDYPTFLNFYYSDFDKIKTISDIKNIHKAIRTKTN
jgi:hypothetical protein